MSIGEYPEEIGPRPTENGESPLWSRGRLTLWVEGPRFPARGVSIPRPYALIGRMLGADIRIPHPDVSARHVYLHVDPRGVFAVDLATRNGTRFLRAEDPEGLGLVSLDSWTDHRDERTAWLRVGESFLIAGHKIEIVKAKLDPDSNAVFSREVSDYDDKGLPSLLEDCDPRSSFASVTLTPRDSNAPPRALSSELVFVGSSGSCGVRIDDRTLPRIAAVFVRTRTGAYIANLNSRDIEINSRPVKHAAEVRSGDEVRFGASAFLVRVSGAVFRPPGSETSTALATQAKAAELLNETSQAERFAGVPVSAGQIQENLLAWMMGAMQAGQGEMIRRQTNFQRTMLEVVQQLRDNQLELMRTQIERMERIDKELTTLRAELERQNRRAQRATAASAISSKPQPQPQSQPLPQAQNPQPQAPNARERPLPHPHPQYQPQSQGQPRPSPARPEPNAPARDSLASTAWLLDRIKTLETENRTGWRDMLDRIKTLGAKPPDAP